MPPFADSLSRARLDRIQPLLAAAGLGTDGLDASHVHVLVHPDASHPMATVALEKYGDIGILRSLAVDGAIRGRGVGRRLVRTLERQAARSGIRMMYLLTESAETYFQALGYRALDRTEVPARIRKSYQYSVMCPESAVVMVRSLESSD